MKKTLIVISLTMFTVLSATSAFAQEVFTSTSVQEIDSSSLESLSERYPEYFHRHSKRQVIPIMVKTPVVRNVVGPWPERTRDQLRSSNFDYPGGIMNVTEERQVSFGGSISSSVLSAALNFDVSRKLIVSDSQNIQVPKGKRARVIAYRIDNVWRYDLYQQTLGVEGKDFLEEFDGTHWARKPVGVWFDVTPY